MRKYCWVALMPLLAACTSPVTAPGRAQDAEASFRAIAAEFISGYLAWRPQTGTSLGLHQYDGKLTDFSRASIANELNRLKDFDARLAEFPTNQLGRQSFYDYRILRAAIQREIFGFEERRAFTRNPMTYAGAIDVNIYIKRNFAPLENRARSLIRILEQAPSVFAQARENLAGSLPRPEIELAMEQADGAADFLSKDLAEALKGIADPQLHAKFVRANERAIQEIRAFSSWLKNEKLPKADENYALGRDRYAKLLEYGELIDIPPERLLELGLRELRKKQQVFADAARVIDPSKPAVEVFAGIQKDHPTEKSLIPDTARDLEKIRQFVVDHDLLTIPSPVRARVLETPQYLRATGFASMDTPGPFEAKATEAYYYVTPPEPDWNAQQKQEWLTAFNYYTTDIVSIHEAYPGHYVQFLCLNASKATRLEKIFPSYAFTEGWAHYAEQMMVDNEFGAPMASRPSAPLNHEQQVQAAKYLLAQADEALLRLCRMCVSIQMHCQGMKVDEATKFFQDNCYYEEKPARQEAMRGTYDPEYLYYTVGKLEILKLRADYRRQEGARFSLKQFHDEFLRHGAPPIRLLREVLLKDRSTWDDVL